MNILHMKYVVTVAKCGSINRAAEELLVAQPNLSRAIKDLESDLHLTIFHRTSKGMVLTPEGEQFVGYARQILRQIDQVEQMYKKNFPAKQTFSISVPRAGYIADAFVHFSRCIGHDTAEIFYKETNALRAIRNILEENYGLGIIRYADKFEPYFQQMLEEKEMHHELITKFRYRVLVQKNSPLAQRSTVHYNDLAPLIEIAHADPYVPSLSLSSVKKTELPDIISRRIFVFERGSQFDLLCENPETFMWVSPMPDTLLRRYGLVELECPENEKQYQDVLIHRKSYTPSPLDNRFIQEVKLSIGRYF